MTIPIRLSGRAAQAPRLPPLLQGAARSADQRADPFLPEGYLEPTGTFDVGPAARGGDDGVVQQRIEARPQEIVVLELTDGSALVTSAARLRAALEQARPELLGPGGELERGLEAEGGVVVEDEAGERLHLGRDLRFQQVDVAVVLRKLPHARQATQSA